VTDGSIIIDSSVFAYLVEGFATGGARRARLLAFLRGGPAGILVSVAR